MGRDADVWTYLKTARPPGPLSGGRSFLQALFQLGPPGLKPGLASPRDGTSRGDPFGSDFLGGNEFRLRQGFGGAKTLGRRCAPSLLGKGEVRWTAGSYRRCSSSARRASNPGLHPRGMFHPAGTPLDPTSSAEMNSACGKVLEGPKRLDGAARRVSWARGKSGGRPALTGAAPIRPAGPQTRACPGGRTYSAYRLPRRADRRGSPPGDSRRARRRIQRNR